MATLDILYPDGTLSKIETHDDTYTLQELLEDIPNSDHYLPGLIFHQDTNITLSNTDIKFLIFLSTNSQGYPKERKTVLHPITITPNTETSAMWETSATSLRKEVTLICNTNGRKKKAIYINQSDVSTSQNALIPISISDYVIKTTHIGYSQYRTNVYMIKEILHQSSCVLLHHEEFISDNAHDSLLSYERYYQRVPQLRSVIRSSKRKAYKGKTSDIHYAEYQHLLKNK